MGCRSQNSGRQNAVVSAELGHDGCGAHPQQDYRSHGANGAASKVVQIPETPPEVLRCQILTMGDSGDRWGRAVQLA
jgi:hypothetical protein